MSRLELAPSLEAAWRKSCARCPLSENARVNPAPFLRRVWPVLLLLTALPARLAAQNLLFVEYEGKPCLVRGARGNRPCIEVDGKRIDVPGNRLALKKVDEYLPAFIAVRDLDMRTTYMTVDGAGQMNNELKFNAGLEAPYELEDVFLLLDMNMDTGGKTFFLYEVGRLEPHQPRHIALTVPLAYALGAGQYQFHLFVGGAEALHTELPFFEREATLDRMVAKRIASEQEAGLKPFLSLPPEYPPALRKANIKGQAVISIRIRTNGSVADPVVKSATDPAFGQAALAAVRLWRFLPRVKHGQPVETKVELPFVFAPPEQPAK